MLAQQKDHTMERCCVLIVIGDLPFVTRRKRVPGKYCSKSGQGSWSSEEARTAYLTDVLRNSTLPNAIGDFPFQRGQHKTSLKRSPLWISSSHVSSYNQPSVLSWALKTSSSHKHGKKTTNYKCQHAKRSQRHLFQTRYQKKSCNHGREETRQWRAFMDLCNIMTSRFRRKRIVLLVDGTH